MQKLEKWEDTQCMFDYDSEIGGKISGAANGEVLGLKPLPEIRKISIIFAYMNQN